MKTSFLMLFAVFSMALTGCSSDYLRDDYRRPSARAVPKIPEIRPQATRPTSTAPKKVVKPYKPAVKKYTISSSTSTEITQKDVEAVGSEAQEQPSVEIDPYASIPESGSVNTRNPASNSSVEAKPFPTKTSPAVTSLMLRARADLSIGKTQSAISKLERGLRIESQNPNIWHLLAKAQYDQSNHQQAISMAKKSIRYSSNDKLIAQNWTLIKKSGEKSDDAIAIKEALDYFKVNP